MLEISIHADHSFAFGFPKTPYDSGGKTAFRRANHNAHIVALALQSRNGFNRPIARIVINNNDFRGGKGGGESRMGGEGLEESSNEGSNVEVFAKSRDDNRA